MRLPSVARIGLILLPFLWLAPILSGGLGKIHSAPGADYSDLVVAHGPNAEFLRQSLRIYGEIPQWNPRTLGGTPFAGDPLSGMYYPPLWLALILPPPLAFNLLFLLHLAFAGAGAYLLAKEEGATPIGALLAGIAFGGMPKLVAHIGVGHLTLVSAVSWTPWLLLAVRKAARTQSARAWSLAGLTAGIVFLADPRWAFPSALAATGYAFAAGRSPQGAARTRILSWAKNLLLFGVFAAAVSAVLALPMAEFVALSTRAGLSGTDAAAQSLPFLSLLGLFLGGIGGSAEWVAYPGLVVLALAFISIPRLLPPFPTNIGKEGRGAGDGGMGRFWLILFLIAVFLSLGSNIPGMSAWLNAIPGVNLLRVPPRWMFLAGLALAMLAARGLTALESATKALDIHWKAGFALAAAGIVLAVASSAMDLPSALWQDGLILFALGGIFFLGFSSRHLASRAILALMCLAVFDLALADSRLIDARPADLSTADERAAAAFLQSEGSEYRVYSPSYSVSQWTAVRYGLRTLDGVNPLILKSTAETVSAADGVPLAGYSVTLPPFAAGRPAVDNRDAVPDGALLGLLNVRYIVSAFEIPGAMPGVRRQFGSIYVYENPSAMPRAWVAEGPDTWSRPVAGHWARVDYDSPNRMRLTALGPGLLVIAEASYPAWRATVDGKAAELLTVGGWWRAVEIGPGEHSVELDYDASLSRLGFAITALALAAYLGVRRWAK